MTMLRFSQCTVDCTTDCGHCKGRPVEALRAELDRARQVWEAAKMWRSADLAWQGEGDTPAWNMAVSRLAAAVDAAEVTS